MGLTLILMGCSGLLFVLSIIAWDIRKSRKEAQEQRSLDQIRRSLDRIRRAADHISDDECRMSRKVDKKGRFQ